MLHELVTSAFRRYSGQPCFRAYGKASYEAEWEVVDVFATHRRDWKSPWPFWRGTCITWSANVLAVGWDFARLLVEEQIIAPATRQMPVTVPGGRLRGKDKFPTASQILAHEMGHTGQVRRMDWCFWPILGAVTLFREGPHFWNHFENQASETGQFGGIVPGSLSPALAHIVEPQLQMEKRS